MEFNITSQSSYNGPDTVTALGMDKSLLSITSLSRLFISFAVIWSMLYNQVFVWSVILFSTSQLRHKS